MLSDAFALFASIRQDAELLVPFAFERVGDEAVIGIDEHETALGEIGVRLGALYRAMTQPIGFFMPCFDLFADLNRQLDGCRCHLLGDQHTDGLIDGRCRDRLAQGFTVNVAGAITNVPGLLSTAPGSIAHMK